MHNIHHELSETVNLVREDAIGSQLRWTWLLSGFASLAVCLITRIPLAMLIPVLLVTAARWVHLTAYVLPATRVGDGHLGIVAEIGFNAREAGVELKTLLKLNGYVTYEELCSAEEAYHQDNNRKYRLREPGATLFLTEAPET